MSYYAEIASFISQTILEAGAVLVEKFKNVTVSTKEGLHNTVTEADLLSQELITEKIVKFYPNHQILGEESDARPPLNSASLWIIDPLDGTNNYASGMPHFSISIAYCEQGVTKVGAVLDPLRNELFIAISGEGAFLNDQRITTATRPILAESLVCTGFYYDRGRLMELTLDAIKALFNNGLRGIRRTGSAALDLAWVACGRFDGFFEYQLSVWDYAAGWLLVTEAGGIISDRDGSGFSLQSIGVISGSQSVFEELLGIVQWSDDNL